MGIISSKYDTLWRRIGAGFIDSIVLAPLSIVTSWISGSDVPVIILIGVIILQHCSPWIYNVLMHGLRGQTVGKMATGITVLDVSERKMSMVQAFLRESFYVAVNVVSVTLYIKQKFGVVRDPASIARIQGFLAISGFIWFVLEIVTTLFDNRRRALHDHIAGTVVVRNEFVNEPIKLQLYERIELVRSQSQPDGPDGDDTRAKSYAERR